MAESESEKPAETLEIGGVKIPIEGAVAAALGKFVADRRFTLPSGRQVALRKGIGADVVHAMTALRLAKTGKDAYGETLPVAILAEIVQIDGQPITYQELLALSSADFLELYNEGLPGNFPLPASPASSKESPSAS